MSVTVPRYPPRLTERRGDWQLAAGANRLAAATMIVGITDRVIMIIMLVIIVSAED